MLRAWCKLQEQPLSTSMKQRELCDVLSPAQVEYHLLTEPLTRFRRMHAQLMGGGHRHAKQIFHTHHNCHLHHAHLHCTCTIPGDAMCRTSQPPVLSNTKGHLLKQYQAATPAPPSLTTWCQGLCLRQQNQSFCMLIQLSQVHQGGCLAHLLRQHRQRHGQAACATDLDHSTCPKACMTKQAQTGCLPLTLCQHHQCLCLMLHPRKQQ